MEIEAWRKPPFIEAPRDSEGSDLPDMNGNDEIGPLFKLPGGKSTLAAEIAARMPSMIQRYLEPFCGGAAVWCHLMREKRLENAKAVCLNDFDYWLVECLLEVKAAPVKLSENLQLLKSAYEQEDRAESIYYAVRDSWNRNVRSATKRIFLSQTSFNGLWRENKQGLMNAAWGKNPTVSVPSPQKLMAMHSALQKVDLVSGDFMEAPTKQDYALGSVIYFDPPYLSTWNSYKAKGFGLIEHANLLELARALGKSGATVLLSNDGSDETRALISKHWPEARIETLYTRRKINRDGAGRGLVGEVLCSVNATHVEQ